MATAIAGMAVGTVAITQTTMGVEILREEVGKTGVVTTATRTVGAGATTMRIRQAREAAQAQIGKTRLDLAAVPVHPLIDIGVIETTTHPAREAARVQTGRTRPDLVADQVHLLIAAGVIETTTPRARAVVPAQIGRILQGRVADPAVHQVGAETTAEAMMAGVVVITGTGTGAIIATTATGGEIAGGEITTIMATGGDTRHVTRAGVTTTITMAAIGIRTGTTMAGTTAGAGTSR